MNSRMIVMLSILLPMNSLLGMQSSKRNVGNVIMPGLAVAGIVVAGVSFWKLAKQKRVNRSINKQQESLKTESENISRKEKALGSIEQILATKILVPDNAFSVDDYAKGKEEIAKHEAIIMGTEAEELAKIEKLAAVNAEAHSFIDIIKRSQERNKNMGFTRLGFSTIRGINCESGLPCAHCNDAQKIAQQGNAKVFESERKKLADTKDTMIKDKAKLAATQSSMRKPWQLGALGVLGIGMGAFAVFSMATRK